MKNEELKLHQLVTGEIDWTELDLEGVEIKFDENNYCIVKSKSKTIIRPTIDEINIGIERLEQDKKSLGEWASVVLCSDLFDLEELNNNQEGEKLLELLWDISFRNK
jgi:hypothetical protein